jgi:hypothetical protein
LPTTSWLAFEPFRPARLTKGFKAKAGASFKAPAFLFALVLEC